MKMCRWKVWSGLALTFTLLCAPLLRADTRMTILRDTGQGDEPEEAARVIWSTDPGIRYELQESDDMEHWTTVEGFPTEAQALAQQYIIMRETAGTRRFFRVRMIDEQPPGVTRRIPAHGAFGVRRFSAITMDLDDGTGIDPDSILLTVGTHGTFTLADDELSYVDGTLVFDLGGDTALGVWGETIEVSLTVADMLGNTETYGWSFRLELEPVYVEELFVFGSPDALSMGQQARLTPTNIMTQRWGNETGPLHMNDHADPWHLESVADDHLVIVYEGDAPPHFVVGQYLANIAPVTMNEIFYRKITAREDAPATSTLTLMTVDVPFAEIALQDSFRLDEATVAFEVDEHGNITHAMDLATSEGRTELELIEIDWSGMPVFGTYTGSEGSFESVFELPLSGTPPGAASWDSQLILDQASLRVTPILDLAFETSRLIELEMLKADILLRVDAALVPRYEIESESVATNERGTLWQHRYIIPVKMAWIEVHSKLDLATGLSAGLSGSISGGATGGFSSHIVVDYERGRDPNMQYQHGLLDRHFEGVQPTLLLNGPFGAYARLIPELDISVLSLTGFYVNVDPGTTLTGSATVQDLELTSAELKIKLDADLNAGMALLGVNDPEWLPALQPVSILNPPWEYTWTHPEVVGLHFVQEPGNTTVQKGQPLTLISEARGPASIRYQWYQDGLPVPPQDRILTRGSAHEGMAGQYHVQATGGGLSAVSKTATVTVTPAPPPDQAPPVLTGTVNADIKDADGTERLPAGEISAVRLYRASGDGKQARVTDPVSNPIEFPNVPYGTYTLRAYGWDTQTAVSAPFAVDAPDRTVVLHANNMRPLAITVYYSDEQTPYGGATVKLDSWNGVIEQWTERATDTTEAASGSVTFLTWPTTLPGEKYRVRIINGEGTQVGEHDNVTLEDTDTGSSYAVTTSQVSPPDPDVMPEGMVLIPGGTNAGTDPDFGAYSLMVTSFYMDRHEVTKALWDEVYPWAVLQGGYNFDNVGSGKAANHPVHTVNWYDAVKWCNARSEKEGRPAVYRVNGVVYRTGRSNDVVQNTAAGYRLPTDVEWEYAARGGFSGRRFPWGDAIQHAQANYWSHSQFSYDTSPTSGYHPTYTGGGFPYTSPVGSFAPNGYGLYDMAGNVWEWCFTASGSFRVGRGGSWYGDASFCRVATRISVHPDHAIYGYGFRSVLSPDQAPPIPTGTVWADIKDADAAERLPAGEITTVRLYRASDAGEQARVTDPVSNPIEFPNVPYGTYTLHAYGGDIRVAVSAPFSVDAPEQTVVLHASEKRPLEITVYYSDGQTPFGGATVKLDSWNGQLEQWTERASDTADAVSGNVTFLTWPTTLPGEKYRIRILNGEGTQVGEHDNVTLADAEAGSSYAVTTSQDPPPDLVPGGMVLIPGGTNVGTDPDFGAYSLTVTSFYMDRYPVTKELWDEVRHWAVTHGEYSFDNSGFGKAADHPSQPLNWYTAVKWCNARSEMEKRPAVYTVDGAVYRTGQSNDVVQTNATGYRLPTDVEWEYAARGGLQGKRFPWGDTINHSHANYRANGSAYSYDTSPYTTWTHHPTYATGSTPYTSPVGSFAANGYGLYDMIGNILEWVFDWHPSYVGSRRVVRGGGWNSTANDCRVAIRLNVSPGSTWTTYGFRSVLSPDQEPDPVPTGTVWADVLDASGTARLSEGDISAVQIHRSSVVGAHARVNDPVSNPVELSNVPYDTYTLKVYCRDMLAAISPPFVLNSQEQTVVIHAGEERPVEITVYYNDGQTPFGGSTVKLDSWNGQLAQWTERASGTADAASGSVTFLTWPTTLPGEKYRVRILNALGTQVYVHDNVTLADTEAGSSYSMSIPQAPPPDPDTMLRGMALIPGGTNAGTDPDFGAYSLTVDSFYMDRYQVTKALWDEVRHWAVTHGGYSFDRAGSGKARSHPVHTINWYDAVKWCNARSEQEGRSAVYTVDGAVYRTGRSNDVVQTSAAGYRLPTDVEWEYAARGGLQGKRFPWGDTIQHTRANYQSFISYTYDTSATRGHHPTYNYGVFPYTSPVGSFAANGYWLHDMSGNVREWCFDWHPSYLGSRRVGRGGGWSSEANWCRVADRSDITPGSVSDSIGFRSVLSPDQEPDPVPTGTVWADVLVADGTARLPAGEIATVHLHRASDDGELARVPDPGSNPVEFWRVPYGTYTLHVYSRDMRVAVSSPFAVDAPDQTVVLHANHMRPLAITVYYSDEQTPFGGATVKLDSWNGQIGHWTEPASDTTDAVSGSVTFLTWPTTLPGEKYRVRILNEPGTQVGVHANVTLADTDAGSSYSVTTTQVSHPDAIPKGMVLIPGGTNAGTDPDFGAYSLTVNTFYMDRYPVTKALWDEVYHWAVTHGGYRFYGSGGSGKAPNHPVHTVNWFDVVKWCNARSEMEGRPAVYTANGVVYRTDYQVSVVQTAAAGYRLPADVEWEYAARGGLESKRFPWGDEINHSHANYVANGSAFIYDTSPYTTGTHHPTYATGGIPFSSSVGSFAANGYWLHDMSGTMAEWCFDWHPSYLNTHRVRRGGSWNNGASACRVTSLFNNTPLTADAFIGFRSVLSPDQEPEPVPTGTVWADVKDASGTAQLPVGEITMVLLHRASDNGEPARVPDPGSNPVEFWRVPYGTYTLQAYGRDMRVAISSPFVVDSPDQTVVLHAHHMRPLEITVYYSDEQTPFGGATVKLDSWNGYSELWIERASDTTDAVSGSVTFLTWPTTLPGEKYRVRIFNLQGAYVGVHDDVTLADTETGSNYPAATVQPPPPDPGAVPEGMVTIPGGTNAGTDPEAGAYSLTVTSFYMDRFEVTKALWDEVYQWAVTHRGYSFDRTGSVKAANHPVHTINWYDAVKWCNARSEMEGRPALYMVDGAVYRTGQSNNVVQTTAAGYRLPTEVEWEYAARGGLSGRRFPWGDTINHSHANYSANGSTISYDSSPYTTNTNHPMFTEGLHPYTSPVGSFTANGYGLHDMSGNVAEWCFDWHPSYLNTRRVTRGGSWHGSAWASLVTPRDGFRPTSAGSANGFRAVLSPDQEPDPVPTGTVWADVKDADGTVLFPEGDISGVLLYRASDDGEQARVADPLSNPVEFSNVHYGAYSIKVFCWDMETAVSSLFVVDAPDQSVVLDVREKRSLEITVYYNDGQTLFGGATVKLDSRDKRSGHWTERASGTTEAASASVTFLAWPTTVPGEKYRVRIFNGQGAPVGVYDNVTVADTEAGSTHSVTTTQPPPPDPDVVPAGMVLIPGGTNAGSNPLAEGETYHPVLYPETYSLTVDPFYMDQYPVTKELWLEVSAWAATRGGYDSFGSGSSKAANHPVVNVTWYQVVKWCNARSEMEGRPAVYTVNGEVYRTGNWNAVVQTQAAGYRLPTDLEWEYAARGGLQSKRFFWGDTIQHARANYYSDSSYSYDTSATRGYHPTYATGDMPYTSPVGSFAANGYGLHDMSGNLPEWVFDWHPSWVGSRRALRGGRWSSTAADCRVATRLNSSPGYTWNSAGFRSVLSPGPAEAP